MLGLIKKDLLMTKSNFKTIILIFVVYMFVAANGNNNFSFIPVFISVIVMMSTFSYDEYNKTNAYISTLPNGRKNAIKSKYIATLLILAISLACTVLVTLILQIVNNTLNMEEIASIALGCSFAVILLQSILYPFIFKFGIEKSRIGMFIGVFSITGIGTILMKSGVSVKIPEKALQILNQYWMILIPLTALLILFISYNISKRLFLSKEF